MTHIFLKVHLHNLKTEDSVQILPPLRAFEQNGLQPLSHIPNNLPDNIIEQKNTPGDSILWWDTSQKPTKSNDSVATFPWE